MASTLKLEIVTPEAKVYSEDVDSVRLPLVSLVFFSRGFALFLLLF